MKRALTGIAAAAVVLGTIAPAAFASTTAPVLTAGGGKSITVNGSSLYSGVQVGNAKDAGTTTTYFPIWYLEQALTKAGYTNSYDSSKATWDITMPGVDASKITVDGGVGTGNAAISINGTVVKKFNAKWAPDLAGGKNAVVTTYFPVFYLGNVLKASGFTNAWDGNNFGFTQAQTTASVTATGAKTLKVSFNKAVDPSKASVTLAKGTVSVNTASVTFASDNKSATVVTTTNLTKGTYTVSVAGVSDKTLTSDVTVDDQKVATINILSGQAAIVGTGTSATVGYQVLNQYGEDITTDPTTPAITYTSSNGTAVASGGVLTLTPASGTFTVGNTLTVTAVEPTSGTVATKSITIGNASATAAVTVDKLYSIDGSTLDTSSTPSNFVLLFSAKDQYGTAVTNPTNIKNDLIVTSSNPSVVNLDVNDTVANQGPNSNELGIPLKATVGSATDGTATIRLISKSSGTITTFDVTVKKAAGVDTFSLSAPTTIVGAGETVALPFTAADQYGTAVTSYAGLNGKVTLTASSGTVAFAQDYVNNKAVVNYTAPNTAGTYTVLAVTPTGKSSLINVQVQAAAVPTVVSKVQNLSTAFLGTATTNISASNIVVNDQYGRPVDLSAGSTFWSNYKINVAVKDGSTNVVTAAGDITSGTATVPITGVAAGTKQIELSLVSLPSTTVVGSQYDFNVKDVATTDISSFKVDDVATMFNDAAHKVALNAYGVLADGTKVALPTSQYSVSTTNALAYSAGQLDASAVTVPSGSTTTTASVIVIFDGGNTVTKTVTVSNVAPTAATIAPGSTANVTYANGVASATAANATVANLLAAVNVNTVDQYGVAYAITSPNVVVTNLVKSSGSAIAVTGNGTSSAAISGAQAGDTFTITFVTADGKTASLKVVVTA